MRKKKLQIERKLHEIENQGKNGKLGKLRNWENETEKRRKGTKGKIDKTRISHVH